MPETIGMEARVSIDDICLEGRRTNNPEQMGVSYMTIQAVRYTHNRKLIEHEINT